ncbi:putative major facilitator superfamily [Diplodia seriata]|uniref:Putative major facilitator superfamily n=1 Tax=Diplodia seriata TaxID=420778 RepID=A0A0G2DX83_9PEZI|nr:putative major facilitator superfamily [Diplodia seriata]
MVVAIALAWLLVPSHTQEDASATDDDDDDDNASAPPAKQPSIFSRLDIFGSVALTATILLLMFPLELGGQKIPWSHPLIPILLGSAIVTGTLFIHFERRAGSSSVLPLAIFRSRDTSIALVIMALQVAAQGGMMFTVPLYFQITDGLSATRAGAHLFPAVLGNTASGLLSGAAIARTGRYKALVTLGTVCTSACYVLMLLSGFGTGMAASALFIAMTASVAPAHVAIASSTMYLAGGVGALVGMASSAAVLQTIVHRGLQGVVGPDFPDRDDFLRRCLEDIGFLQRLRGSVKERIVHVYVQGFRGAYADLSNGESLAGALAQVDRQLHERGVVVETILFNAARVGESDVLTFSVGELEQDFKLAVSSLYTVAQWIIPRFLHDMAKGSTHEAGYKPTLLVTGGFLHRDPYPPLFSLSAVKAAQYNLVCTFHKMFRSSGIHCAMILVGGFVSPKAERTNPKNIAEKAWTLYEQGPDAREIEIVEPDWESRTKWDN